MKMLFSNQFSYEQEIEELRLSELKNLTQKLGPSYRIAQRYDLFEITKNSFWHPFRSVLYGHEINNKKYIVTKQTHIEIAKDVGQLLGCDLYVVTDREIDGYYTYGFGLS